METQSGLELVSKALALAKKHDLEAEVVYFALKTLKNTPTMTEGEAMTYGLNKLIKHE